MFRFTFHKQSEFRLTFHKQGEFHLTFHRQHRFGSSFAPKSAQATPATSAQAKVLRAPNTSRTMLQRAARPQNSTIGDSLQSYRHRPFSPLIPTVTHKASRRTERQRMITSIDQTEQHTPKSRQQPLRAHATTGWIPNISKSPGTRSRPIYSPPRSTRPSSPRSTRSSDSGTATCRSSQAPAQTRRITASEAIANALPGVSVRASTRGSRCSPKTSECSTTPILGITAGAKLLLRATTVPVCVGTFVIASLSPAKTILGITAGTRLTGIVPPGTMPLGTMPRNPAIIDAIIVP